MRKVSTRRFEENKEYAIVRMKLLIDHPRCQLCGKTPVGGSAMPRIATETHHFRGRTGRLLNDRRFLMSACSTCHNWVHDNGAEARNLGLLAPIAEFNVYPE